MNWKLSKKDKIIISSVFVTLVLILVIKEIELPLPEDVKKNNVYNGEIKKCRIKLGEGSTRFKKGRSTFVGFTLEGSPYLRWNPGLVDIQIVKKICDNMKFVQITYTASRNILRPKVTYWVDQIVVPDMDLTLK